MLPPLSNFIDAKLEIREAISKTGNPYKYVSVLVDGEEISRLFLKPLEIKALFNK